MDGDYGYICLGCKRKFREFDTKRSFLAYYGDRPIYDQVAICPYCGDYDIEELDYDRRIRGDDEEDDDVKNEDEG